jgi:hypothetical protein
MAHDRRAGYAYPLADTAPPFFDRSPATGFYFFLHNSTLSGFLTKLECLSSAGLVSSTTRRVIFMAALGSRFTKFFAYIAGG